MATAILGYALDEPTAAACGSIVDDVPDGRSGNLVDDYQRWRSAAEAQLQSRVQSGALKVWVPVAMPHQQVISLFGGNPAEDWDGAVSMMLKACSEAGQAIRLVDFTSLVARPLHRRLSAGKFPGRYVCAELSPGGTLDPLQGITDPGEAAALLADVMRAEDDRRGRNSAAATQNLMSMVMRHLDSSVPLSLARARAAVSCALTAQVPIPGALSAREEAAIINGPYAQFKQTPTLVQALFDLDSLLALIADFGAAGPPYRLQGDPARGAVSLLSVGGGLPPAQRELAGDILAARIAREMQRAQPVTTVILGADGIPSRLLDVMALAAQSGGSQLFMLFERLRDGAKDRLGWHAGSVTGFFRLSHHEDATAAADFLGKQHKMVLAGLSESRTKSFEWGWSTTVTHGVSSHTSHAWSIGRSFSSTLSSASSRSRSTAQGTSGGGSATSGTTTSYERVYEHLIEPSVFQGLGPGALLLVDVSRRAARLTSCSRDITRSDLVDWASYVEIAEA